MISVFERTRRLGVPLVLSALGLFSLACPMSDPYFVEASAGAGGGASGESGASAASGSDGCPTDPRKTDPGACGCGFPETPACLIHRYSFDDTTASVSDSVSGSDGTSLFCVQADGALTLNGSSAYVTLPSGIVSSLSAATFEVWVTWTGVGPAWQRIFDLGGSSGSVVFGGSSLTYLYLTPENASPGVVQVAFANAGYASEISIQATAPLTPGVMTELAVVVDPTLKRLTLYIDGVAQGSTALSGALSDLSDSSNWLGRSHYAYDPYLSGTLHEFRIFSVARSAAQIAESAALGPDQAPAP